jgi:hypothetical protein
MAKRGRPKKDGLKPGWTLFRNFLVLHAYNQARARGNKHSSAITDAVSAVRPREPGMPISETEVKRVLAEFQSKGSERSWIISPGIVQGPELDTWFDNLEWIAKKSPLKLGVPHLPDYRSKPRQLKTLSIHIGPRPRYPRSNARK